MQTIPPIMVTRDGLQYGPYSLHQTERLILSGTLLLTDLAWHEGLYSWVPLREIVGKAADTAVEPEVPVFLRGDPAVNEVTNSPGLSGARLPMPPAPRLTPQPAPPSPPPTSMAHSVLSGNSGEYARYEDVPWYRRSTINTVFCIFGGTPVLGIIWPLFWFTCGVLFTGEIYMNKTGPDGKLKRWPQTNKVLAVLMLVFQALLFLVSVLWPTRRGY